MIDTNIDFRHECDNKEIFRVQARIVDTREDLTMVSHVIDCREILQVTRWGVTWDLRKMNDKNVDHIINTVFAGFDLFDIAEQYYEMMNPISDNEDPLTIRQEYADRGVSPRDFV